MNLNATTSNRATNTAHYTEETSGVTTPQLSDISDLPLTDSDLSLVGEYVKKLDGDTWGRDVRELVLAMVKRNGVEIINQKDQNGQLCFPDLGMKGLNLKKMDSAALQNIANKGDFIRLIIAAGKGLSIKHPDQRERVPPEEVNVFVRAVGSWLETEGATQHYAAHLRASHAVLAQQMKKENWDTHCYSQVTEIMELITRPPFISDRQLITRFGNANLHSYQPTQERDAFLKEVLSLLPKYSSGISDEAVQTLFEADKTRLITSRLQPLEGEAWTGSRCKKVLKIIAALKGPLPQGVSQEHTIDASNLDGKINSAMNAKGEIDRTEFLKLVMAAYRETSPGSAGLSRQDADAFLAEIKQGLIGEVNSMTWSVSCCRDFLRLRGMDGTAEQRWEKNVSDRMRSGLDELLSGENAHDGSSQVKRDAFMKLLCEVFAPETADNIREVLQLLREVVSQLPQEVRQAWQAEQQGNTGSFAPAFPASVTPTKNKKTLSKMNPLQAAVLSLALTSEVKRISAPEHPRPTPKSIKGMQGQPLPVCRPEDKPKPTEDAGTHSALSGVATGVITALLTGNPLLALAAGLTATFSGVEGRSTGTTTTRTTVSIQQDPVAALPPKVKQQAARFISRAQSAALSGRTNISSEIKEKTRAQHMEDFAAAYAYEKTAESNWAAGTGDVLVSGPQTVIQRMREEDPALSTKTVDQIQQDSLYVSQLAGEVLHGDYKVPDREMAGNPQQAYDRELQRINDKSTTPASQTASTAATAETIKTAQTLPPTVALLANGYLTSTLRRLAAEAHNGATSLATALLDTRLRQPYLDAFTTEFHAGTDLDLMRQRYPAFKNRSDNTIQHDPVYIQHLMDKNLYTTTTQPAYRTSDVRTLIAPEMALIHNQLSVINRLRGEADNTSTLAASQATLAQLNELALTLNSVRSLPVVNFPEQVEITNQLRSLQQLQNDVTQRISKTEGVIFDHEARATDAFLSLEPEEFLGDLSDRYGNILERMVTVIFVNDEGKKQALRERFADLFEFIILPGSEVTYPAGFPPGVNAEIERYRSGTAEQTAAEQAKLARKAELSLIKLDKNIKEGWPVNTNANARIETFIQREINRLVPPGPDGKPVYTPETLIPVKRTRPGSNTAATSTFNAMKRPIVETHSIKSLLCGTVERMHFEDLKDVLPPDALRPLFAPPRTATWSSGRYPYQASKRVINNLESDRLTMMAPHRKTARREVTQGVILQSLSLLARNTGAPEHVQQAAQKLLNGGINPSTMKFGDYEIEGVFSLPLNNPGAEKEYLLIKPFDTLKDTDTFDSMVFRPGALTDLKYAQKTWEFLESSLPAEALLKAEDDPDLKRAFWLPKHFRTGSYWPSIREAGGKVARRYTQPGADLRFFNKHEPYAFNEIAKGREANAVGKLADKLATIEENGWITRDDLLILSEQDYNTKRYIGWAKDAVQFFSLLSMLIPSVPLEIAVSLGLTAIEYGLDYAEAELEHNPVEREDKHSQAKFLGLMSLYLEIPGAAASSISALRHAERSQHQALKQLKLRPKKSTMNTKVKSAPDSVSDALSQARFPIGKTGNKDLPPGRISGQGTSLNPSGPKIELSHPSKTFSLIKNTSEKSDTLIFDAHGMATRDASTFKKFLLKSQNKKPSPHDIPLPDNHIISFDAPHEFINTAGTLPGAAWDFQLRSPFVTIRKKGPMVFNPYHNFPLTADDVWKFFPDNPKLNKQAINAVGIDARSRKHLQVAPRNEDYLGRGTNTPGAIRNYEHEKMLYTKGTDTDGKPIYMTNKEQMDEYAKGMTENHNRKKTKLIKGKEYLTSPDIMVVREGKVTTTEKALGTIQSNPEFSQYKHIVIVSCRVEPGGHWTRYYHTSMPGPKGAGHFPGQVHWRTKPQYQVTEATYSRDIKGKLRLTKLRTFPGDMPEEEKKVTETKATEATRFTGVSFKRDGLSIAVNQTTTMESLAEQYKQAYNLKKEMDEIKEEFIAQNPELPASGTIAPGTILNPPAIQLPAAGQPYVTRGDESFNDIKAAIEKQYGPESAALFSVLNGDLAQESNANKTLPVDKSFDLADVLSAALLFQRSAGKITTTLDSTMENLAGDLIRKYGLREENANFVAELRSKNPELPATGNISSGTVIFLPDIKFQSSGDIYETRGYESFGDFLDAIESREGFAQAIKCRHLNSNYADSKDRDKVLPPETRLKINGEIYSNNDKKITLSVPVTLSVLAREFKKNYRYEDRSANEIIDDFRRSNPDISMSDIIPRDTILNRPDIDLQITDKVYKTRGYESFNDLYTAITNVLGKNKAQDFQRRYIDYIQTSRWDAILPADTAFYLTAPPAFSHSFRIENGKAVLISSMTPDTLASELKNKFNLEEDIGTIKSELSTKNPHFPVSGNIPIGTIVRLPGVQLPSSGNVYKARGYESFNDVMDAGMNKHGTQWVSDFLNRYNDFDQPDRRFAPLPAGTAFYLSETSASSMSFRRESNGIIVTWDLPLNTLASELKEKYRIKDSINIIKTELLNKNPDLPASGKVAIGTVIRLPDIQLPSEKGEYSARGYETFSDVLNAGIAMYGAEWADKFLLRYGELLDEARRDNVLASGTKLDLS